MIILWSTTSRAHELNMDQRGVWLTILFSNCEAIAFRLRTNGRVVACRCILPGRDVLPRGYSHWKDSARVTQELFDKDLRLALRQVIMP